MICPLPDLCAASVAVTSIIGSNPMRLYLAGHVPQSDDPQAPNALIPCVDWLVAAGTTENLLADSPACDYQLVRVRCWAMTFVEADALADAVRGACEASGNCAGLNPDFFDDETLRYCVSFDFRFIVKRP